MKNELIAAHLTPTKGESARASQVYEQYSVEKQTDDPAVPA
jgi:hypothetical protein